MPGYLPANLTNNSVVDSVIKKMVPFVSSRGNLEYGITSTRKLIETSATEITNDTKFPHVVTYDSQDVTSLHDIIVYSSKVSSGGGSDPAYPRVFYS